jgi:hypothetical protein
MQAVESAGVVSSGPDPRRNARWPTLSLQRVSPNSSPSEENIKALPIPRYGLTFTDQLCYDGSRKSAFRLPCCRRLAKSLLQYVIRYNLVMTYCNNRP